ncbi:MAG: putative DNA-binding domain-containing protein [Acidobacteriaceae bacterium]|nr:putative DNA-binding domain-containing protein [Acidobacteriaceae bacterium]
MSQLLEFQRRLSSAVMQPLSRGDRMRRSARNQASMEREAEALVKPNSRLSSLERLEIYNQQYWFRILSCFAEDFPGLRAVVGRARFERLMRAYLAECPSRSFTLRNLGAQLEAWLRRNPEWIRAAERLALDMVRLEWAHIEAFDSACEPALTPAELERGLAGGRLNLQPYIRLLELRYAVDDLLIEVHNREHSEDTSSNAAQDRLTRSRVRSYAKPLPGAVYLAVHRSDDSVYYKRLEPVAYQILEAIGAGRSLTEALDALVAQSEGRGPDMISSVQQWFANWAELGWFCRPEPLLLARTSRYA